MTDLHDAFDAWLLGGARDDLPRDVALHASACPACLRSAGALDALTTVDPGLAELPPLAPAQGMRRRFGLLPATATAAVVVLVIGAGIVTGGTVFRAPSPSEAPQTATPAGDVLGGQGAPEVTGTSTPSPTASATASPKPSRRPRATPEPTVVPVTPPPAQPGPAATPPPTPRPTRTPRPPTPAPTPDPTPSPASATASPSPSPSESAICVGPVCIPVP
jgi:hypothetical protein